MTKVENYLHNYLVEWFPNDYSKNPNKIQLSDIFKEVLSKIFSKKLQNAWPGNNLNYVQNLTKYAMAPGAEVISSLYVDQRFLFRFLLQNIGKIKGATLYVLCSLIFSPYFRHDLDCSRVKHFAIFWKKFWIKIL